MNLGNFPYEVLFDILLNADSKTIASYCQTSERASRICRDQSFWKRKYRKDYGLENQIKGLTWQKQYQLGPIKVTNTSISAGNRYYGIIDERGDSYIAGHFSVIRYMPSETPTRVEMESKVISITAGYGTMHDFPFIGAITADGEVYVWGGDRYQLAPTTKPYKLKFPRSGKIIKMVRNNVDGRYGVIMDKGLAYLAKWKLPKSLAII